MPLSSLKKDRVFMGENGHAKKTGTIKLDEDEFDPRYVVTCNWKLMFQMKLCPHKYLVLMRGIRSGQNLRIKLGFEIRRNCDHPGIEFLVAFRRWAFAVGLTDDRHLDEKTGHLTSNEGDSR